ncbi:MAG: DNA topoisomerase IV subunit A [Nitrososphaera sp.]
MPTKDKRHQQVIKKIQVIMKDVSNDIVEEKTMPVLNVPKVGYDNTVWSEKKRMLTIGEKTVGVSPDSTKKIPTFAQYLVMANAVRKLLDEEMESTIRGMYYATLSTVGEGNNKQKFWNGQEDSDDAIKAIELLTSVPREEFSVTSKPKGMISGPITLRVGGDIIDCNLGSRATSQLIPTNIRDVEIIKVKADFVMVVEKDTVLNNIRKSGFIQKYNAILLTGSGEPDRATRMMVKALNEEWKKPVVVFADADPWGLGIALRYKIGSESLSYDSDRLVTPDARVLGMMFSDIYEYNIPEVARLAASEEDINRANDMKKKPWFQDKKWQKELDMFLKRKEKCELDAFFKHGFKYLAEVYLPRKLREAGMI